MRISKPSAAVDLALHVALTGAVHGVTGEVGDAGDLTTHEADVSTHGVTEVAEAGDLPTHEADVSTHGVTVVAEAGDLTTHEALTAAHGVAQVANHDEIASQIATHAALIDYEADHMIGEGNGKWVTCIFVGSRNVTNPSVVGFQFTADTKGAQNAVANDAHAFYVLPMKASLGSRTLRFNQMIFKLSKANGTNFITSAFVWKEMSLVDSDMTDRNSAGTYGDVFGEAQMAAGWYNVLVGLYADINGVDELRIEFVRIFCWYA